jgi:L-ascorbate metabolism protein UlaG (beta-lactamase superfamily)
MLKDIHWLGHDSFRLDGSVTVYIDPWKLPAGQPVAGVILVTHEHFDHLSLPDVEKVSGPDTVLIGPACVTAQVDDVATVTLAPGESADVGGAQVTAVPAYNVDKFRAPGITPVRPVGSDSSYRWTACATTTPATPMLSPRWPTSTVR